MTTGATHDPALRSWVESANARGTDFPIQNLPFGRFRRKGAASEGRVGVAIGEEIFDLVQGLEAGLFSGTAAEAAAACRSGRLNEFMALGRQHAAALRGRLSELLRAGNEPGAAAQCLVPSRDVGMLLPAEIRNFSDFSISLHHNATMGRIARPDAPLFPNFPFLPLAYHGRASSIVVSGTPYRRPRGQLGARTASTPTFGAARQIDYELEIGACVGRGNALGEPIALERAEQHLFGVCLLNDWSARDMQSWEGAAPPYGPFLSKSAMTTISPWIVTLDALAPFRVPPEPRPAGDPPLLDYLDARNDREAGAIDVTVEAWITTERTRARGEAPVRLSTGRLAGQYWTVFQMLAHQTSNGCNVVPGDILATGTISGPGEGGECCLAEKTLRGTRPITLPNGEQRAFLEDGDEIVFRGYCERDGFVRIGLGECSGRVEPAANV